MAENSIRPPEAPKPSGSSSLSTNRLKNRLILGWSRLPANDEATQESGNSNNEPVTMKGFGEGQFDIADAFDPNRSMLGMGSSLWSENTFTKKLNYSSTFATNTTGARKAGNQFQNSLTGDSVASVNSLTSLRGAQFAASTATRPQLGSQISHLPPTGVKKTPKGTSKRKRVQDASRMPHLSVSQLYSNASGWGDVAASMAVGDTEFCYLQSDAQDSYKFSLQDAYPVGRIAKNDFVTMSKHGVMRSSVITGESEMVSHEDMLLEHAVYHQLVQIRVFKQFRLWKMFYVWRHTTKKDKYARMRETLQKSLLLVHPFYRCLISHTITHCLSLQELVVLPLEPVTVYDQKSFAKYQKHAVSVFKTTRDTVMDKLIHLLCRLGQEHVHTMMAEVPSVVSMAHYNTLKAGSNSTTVAITAHVQSGGAAVALEKQHNRSMSGVAGTGKAHSTHRSAVHPSVATTAPAVVLSNASAASATTHKTDTTTTASADTEKITVSYTEKAAIRTNCRRLASLFRLVDFMVRDALYSSVLIGFGKIQCIVEGASMLERQVRRLRLFAIGAGAGTGSGSGATNAITNTSTITAITTPQASGNTTSSISISDFSTLTPAEIETLLHTTPVRERAIFRLVVDIAPTATSDDEESSISSVIQNNKVAFVEHNTLQAHLQRVAQSSYSLVFDVSLQHVHRTFTDAAVGTMRAAAYKEGLLSIDMCTQLLYPIINEITSYPLEDRFVHGDTAVHTILHSCNEVVSIDYTRATHYVQQYAHLCDTYLLHTRILETAESTQLTAMPPEIMAEILELFKTATMQCSSVCDVYDIGVFRLEFGALKAKVSDIITQCRTLFYRIVPELYVSNGDILYNELSHLIAVLDANYTTLDAYVKVVEVYNKTVLQNDHWSEKFAYIMSIRDILSNETAIVKSDAIVRQNLTLVTVWQRYTTVMSEFEDAMVERSKLFQMQLKQRTRALVLPLEQAREFLHSTAVHDHTSDADVIITQLHDYMREVEVVLQKGQLLEHYQTVLKYAAYNHAHMHTLHADLHSMHALWSLVKLIKELQISFMSVNFLDAASSEVEKQLRYVKHTIEHKLVSDGSNSSVSAVQVWLCEALQHLQVVAPVVKKLQAPTQKATHIARIHALLQRSIYSEEDVSVGELVDVVHILTHAAELDVIYEESLFEYNLEASMKNVHKKLHAQEYVLTHEKDNSTLIYASNCAEIGTFLEDCMCSVVACMNSKYAAPHREVFAIAQSTLLQWVTSHTHFAAVQAGYLRIRILFTCARTARFLSSSVKHFKILDENWRAVIKHAKAELKIGSVYDNAELCECLVLALQAIQSVDRDLRVHIRDQCIKYPKLYLLDTDYLVHVYATLEPALVFAKCRILYPALTDVLFLADDVHTCSGVKSHTESVTFRKPCSARSSLVDWLRAVESGVNDRVEHDMKEYMCGTKHLLEDLKFSRGVEQSRVACVQAMFWSELLKHFHSSVSANATGSSMQHALQGLLHDTIDQLSLYAGLTVNHAAHMDTHHRRCIENLQILLIHHRDIIYYMLDNERENVSFMLECSVKKLWDSETSTMYVKQGQHKRTYGNKYCGFGERLVVTPFTDKFFLSVSNVVESGGLACIVGSSGSGKLHTTTALAQEFGLESMCIDMRNVKNVDSFARIVRAHVGSGIWCNYTNMNSISQEMLSVVLTVFSAVHSALANGESSVYLCDQKMDIADKSVGKPRFSLHFHSVTMSSIGTSPNTFSMFPPSVRRQFRILHYTAPPRRAIFTVLLTANNFTNVTTTATKLEALCEYILSHQLCPESILLQLLVKTIPLAKLNYVHPTAPHTQQLGIYTKLLISQIPWALQERVNGEHLRYICNLFLEVIYTPEKDVTEFKRVASVSDCAALLYEQLLHGKAMSVIVSGGACSGKSTLIREVAGNACTEHNTAIVRAAASTKYHTSTVKAERNMSLYPRVCNVFSMAHYIPPARESSEYRPHLAPALHSALLQAAEAALVKLITSIDVNGDTTLLHMEVQSSLQLSYLLPLAEYYTHYYTRPVKFIWECTELHHIDPVVLVQVPCVCMKGSVFDAEDVIAYQLKRIGNKYCHQLHEALTHLTHKLIRPCLTQRPKDCMQSECALTENVFKMIESLLIAGQLTVVAASLKLWEQTLHRVVVLACVWSVGVCSNTSREAFGAWFVDYFDADMRTNEHHLYPDSSVSLYECALHCVDKEVYLEWCAFDYTTMNKLLGQQTTSENTSEERMRRSYQDIYYTTLLNSTNSLVIPTPTAAAYMLLQSAVMKTGGGVMVTGASGSGKSALLRQLMLLSKAISSAKLSHECASRWVLHTTDCGPVALQSLIQRTKASVLPLLMERKLPERGAVVIDDVSIIQHSDNHTTCAEYLRVCYDTQEMYFSDRNVHRTMSRLYTLLGTNNSVGDRNPRLLRHFMVLCCEESQLNAVFARKLQSQCSILSEDVAHDLSLVTLTLTRMYTSILHKCSSNADIAAQHGVNNLTPVDKVFMMHNLHLSYGSITDYLVSKMCAALSTMGGSYSSNDVVRVYDRTLSDYFVRNIAFSKIYDSVSDTCSATLPFMYASFSSFLDKERTTRQYATEALISSLYNNEPPVYPLSYKQNASGFYDSKSGVHAGIACAESIRDAMFKKHTRSIVPTGVCGDSIAYWTEVMSVCAELSAPRMSGHSSVVLLHNNTPVVHSKVVSVGAVYLYAKYNFIVLDPGAYTSYAPPVQHSSVLPSTISGSTSSIDATTISNTITITNNAEPVTTATTDTGVTDKSNADKSQDNASMSFQEAVTDMFLEAFLLDNIVLRSIKLHNQSLRADQADLLLSPAELAVLSTILPPTQFDIVHRMCTKYATLEVKTGFSDDTVPPERSDRRICVWHLALSNGFCSTPNSMQFLLDTFELRSDSVLSVIRSVSVHLDPCVHKHMREVVCEYRNRQKVVLSLVDTSPLATEAVLRAVHAIPAFPLVSVLSCYESYQSGDATLTRLVGEACVSSILTLVDKLTVECSERLASANKNSLVSTVQSVAYRNDTVQSILSVYHATQLYGFKSRLLLYMRHFAAGCISDVSLLEAITSSIATSAPMSPAGTSYKSYQEDELPDPDAVPVYDTAALGDVVRCVLLSRYCSCVVDTHSMVCSSVCGDASVINMGSICPAEVPVSVLVLSMAAALQYFDTNTSASSVSEVDVNTTEYSTMDAAVTIDNTLSINTNPTPSSATTPAVPNNQLTRYLSLAGSLPLCAARDTLSALCMLLATGSTVTCVDNSFVSLLLLQDLVPSNNALALSTHHISCTFAPDMHTATTVTSSASNAAMERVQSKSTLATGAVEVPIVITAASPLVAELVLIFVSKQQKPQQSTVVNALCEFSSVLESLHSIQYVHNELSALAVLVSTYQVQYVESVHKVCKVCNTVSALFQALAITATCTDATLLAVWNEYSMYLRHYAANVPERRMVRNNTAASHAADNTAPEFVISQSVQVFLTWLERYLHISELYQVLLAVVLNLYLHTSSPLGQTNAHRVLLSLKPVLHETLGIVPLTETDENSDSESEKSSLSGSEHEENDQSVENENFKLTDVTISTLKQSLLSISTAITTTVHPSSSTTANATSTHATQPVRRKSLNNGVQRKSITGAMAISVVETNAGIVNDIRKNIEEWVLWVLDSRDINPPFKGTYVPTWLDKIAVCLCIKPSVVLPTLLTAVESLGLDVHVPLVEHTRTVSTVSVVPPPPVLDTQLVVYTHGVGAKDVISELEHGGTSTTLSHFEHAFKAPDKQIHRAVTRLASQLGGAGISRSAISTTGAGGTAGVSDVPQTRQSMISVQLQQEAALKAALAVQEQDRNVHFFLSEHINKPFVCTPAQLKRLLQCSKVSSRGVETTHANAHMLQHFVVLPSLTRELSVRVRDYDSITSCMSDLVLEVTQPRVLSRDNRLHTPVIAPSITTNGYVLYLQYCYHVAAELPINCPAAVNAVVLRVRWLLVLFHVSVQCKLNDRAEYASVGVDTLIQALINVDTLFTRAYHNVSREEFLAPEKSGSARSSFVSNTTSRRNSNAHAAATTTAVHHIGHAPVVPERPVTRHSDVLKFNTIAWSLDMLVIEISDCLYGQLTPCVYMRDTIRAIYNAYFTVGSLNPTAEYLIKGKVVLPQDLSRGAAERFFREMRTLAEEECSVIELSDSTLAEANSTALLAVHSSVERMVEVWNNRGDCLTSRPLPTAATWSSSSTSSTVTAAPTSNTNATPTYLLDTLHRADTLYKVRRALQRILDHLPAVLDVETPDISVRMKDHKKNLGRPVPMGVHAPQPPIAASEASLRRRRAEKIVTTFESREFDPLWAYLLSETAHYNSDVRGIRIEINEILKCEVSLVQFMTQRGVSLSTDTSVVEKLHALLQDMHDGYIPTHLYTASTTSSVRIDDWCKELADQRAQLHDWLSFGYPGKIRLHLLHNPAGLLYSLKETFCMRTDNTLDKVYIDFRVQEVTNLYLPDLLTISKTNFGCSVMLSDLYLHNALYSEKSSLLEFLPEPSASSHGKRLAVVVTVTKDAHPFNPEEYLCPVHLHSLLPTTHDLLALRDPRTTLACTSHAQKTVLAYIPMETTEDVEDCKMYGVAIHSGHDLTLPV